MKRRPAFVLPLVLVFLLIAGTLISVSLDMATKSRNQAMRMVTTQELYNAAQSGLEWGKTKLLEHSDELDSQPAKDYMVGNSNLSSLYATYTPTGNSSTRVDGMSSSDAPWSMTLNGIAVEIEILDCNYTVNGGTPSGNDGLPPLMPSSTGSGSSGGGNPSFTNGTTVIMDPNRAITSGSGDFQKHYFLIRSTAKETDNPERTKTLETMVVING